MFLAAAGPDALKAIKDMLTAPAKSSSTLLKVDVALARAAALDTKDPNAAKVAREVFGKDPKGSDAISVKVEMGDTLKVSLNAKAKIITLGAKGVLKDK